MELDGVPQAMREPIRDYTDLVRSCADADFQSLTLFGTIVAGSFDIARHTVRSVVVLEKIDLVKLRRLAEHGAKLGKARIAAPLVMTPAYIRDSLDTFPLELIEIVQMHLTILGDDPFGDLKFEERHVRLECERELKTIMIGLRQGLLAAAGRDKALETIEKDMGEGLVRTMRGFLWLKGQKKAKKADEVIASVEEMSKRKLPGVRDAVDATGSHGWEAFQRLYHDVEALSELANDW